MKRLPAITTQVCIVGAGPAGVILAHLMAMNGIDVVLLESEDDFDRDFRGDTVHPSTMEIMEQLGWAKQLLQLPHTKAKSLSVNGRVMVEMKHLNSPYPYVTLLHQKDFLEFITKKSAAYKNFSLLMNTNAQKLLEKNGRVVGVDCLSEGQWQEIRAKLVIGADGRFSRMRSEGGFQNIASSPPMDVLWFKLPKDPKADAGLHTGGRVGKRSMLAMLEREDYWQMGLIIPKGSYHDLREAGLPAFKKELAQLIPHFAKRCEKIKDWKELRLLNVESSCVKSWHREGMLLIGDAAHVISPIGGVGINLAIKDAVTAANILIPALKAGRLRNADLARVQKQRKWPTKIIQKGQAIAQKNIFERVMEGRRPPRLIRWIWGRTFVKRRVAHLIGIGVKHVRIKQDLLTKKLS